MRIYILDNYDSFTFNLKHYFEALNCTVVVERNDEVSFLEIDQADALVLSPGPGLPKEAGQLMEVIECYHKSKPILGVCLGHQAIAEYFGASLFNMNQVYHGKKQSIIHNELGIFQNIPSPMSVGLYHSWAVLLDKKSDLEATSVLKNDIAMSFQHKTLPIFGVQFHPESILTPNGMKLIENFLTEVKKIK